MSRTFGQDVRRKIETISPILFTTEHRYHFLYLSISKNFMCVGKAELFIGNSIKLSEINKNFIDIYNTILGVDGSETDDEKDVKKEDFNAFI
jgi:hypothetical protein